MEDQSHHFTAHWPFNGVFMGVLQARWDGAASAEGVKSICVFHTPASHEGKFSKKKIDMHSIKLLNNKEPEKFLCSNTSCNAQVPPLADGFLLTIWGFSHFRCSWSPSQGTSCLFRFLAQGLVPFHLALLEASDLLLWGSVLSLLLASSWVKDVHFSETAIPALTGVGLRREQWTPFFFTFWH